MEKAALAAAVNCPNAMATTEGMPWPPCSGRADRAGQPASTIA